MPTMIQLTKDQHAKIVSDADEQKDMLSAAEVEAIATKLNDHINIPILSEKKEQVVFVKIVKRIDRFLYTILPNEVYELVKSTSDGVTDDEAEMIEERVSKIINQHVNLPFLSESKEEKVFRFVLSVILGALKEGRKIET